MTILGLLGITYLLSQAWLKGKEMDAQRPRMAAPLPGELEAELLKELRALRDQNERMNRRLEHVETIITADPSELAKALQVQQHTGASIEAIGDTDPTQAAEVLAKRLMKS